MKQKENDVQALLGRLVGTVTSAVRQGSGSGQGADSSLGSGATSQKLLSAVATATATSGGSQPAGSVQALAAATPTSVTATVSPLLSPWQSVAGMAGASGSSEADWLAMVNPLLGAFYNLFSSSQDTTTTTLAKFLLPDQQHYEAGFGVQTANAVVAASRGENGLARPEQTVPGGQPAAAPDTAWLAAHTEDIIEAVKRALLESGNLPELLRDF